MNFVILCSHCDLAVVVDGTSQLSDLTAILSKVLGLKPIQLDRCHSWDAGMPCAKPLCLQVIVEEQ